MKDETISDFGPKGATGALRYSDLAGKEIIDIDQGIRLGVVNDTDLVIDAAAGRVVAIIIPGRGGFFSRRELEIPWHGIKKIGVDLIIVDLSTAVDWHGSTRHKVRSERVPFALEPDGEQSIPDRLTDHRAVRGSNGGRETR